MPIPVPESPIYARDLVRLLREYWSLLCAEEVEPVYHRYKKVRMSFMELARLSGVSYYKLKKILVTGTRDPSISEIDALLQAMGISVRELVTGDHLLHKSKPVPSSLEPHLDAILTETDRLLYRAGKNRNLRTTIGRIHYHLEALAGSLAQKGT